MKWISFVVPCYNSENYLHTCVDSLLTGGNDVEIIIVNDGSTDNTAFIADQYAEDFPSIIQVVHKKNGGHGSAINSGVKRASGKYFKVVDSDDWVSASALQTLLVTIKNHHQKALGIDVYITNFIYDKIHENTHYVRKFNKKFNVDAVSYWKDVKAFHGSEVILMHSLMYRTAILQEHVMELPEHTFYVDNLYAFQYLPYVHKMYYLDIDFYHYYIGREDQSVSFHNIVKRYDQQIRVIKTMIKRYSYHDLMQMEKPLRKYMIFNLSSIMIVTIMFTTGICNNERKVALQEMWDDIKSYDKKLYKKLRFFATPALVNWIPFRIRGILMTWGYRYLTNKVKLG